MKKRHRNHYSNCGHSKVGGSCKNCSNSTTNNFAKNKGTITDNEYEVTSETNCHNCSNKKRSK